MENDVTIESGAPAEIENDNIEKKVSGQGKRALIELIAGAAVLLSICLALILVKNAYVKAEEDYAANNYSSISRLDDGTIRVSGMANGKSFEYVEDGRIIPGVRAAGVELGGMTYQEARAALIEDMKHRVEGVSICATVGNTTIVLTSADFEISSTRDLNELLHQALAVGRSGGDYFSVYEERQRVAEEGLDLGDYELTVDEDKLAESIERAASVVDRSPVEPYITLLNRVGGGKPGVGVGGDASDLYSTKTVYAPNGAVMADIQFHNGKNGWLLDRQDMTRKVAEAFRSGNYNADIEVALVETEPEHTAEELASSITQLSKFSTRFASSGDYRARNVQKAAGLLHCTILSPDVDYSYNEILGPRHESDGWLPAPGIAGGREYIDSPGGGICQVSSTLYNALLKLGPDIKIVRRSHHSIPGSYIDMGLDATVSYGGPDLVWRNVTDSAMILFSYVDMSSRTVYEIIYGVPNSEGATYRVWSEVVETIEPPEPKRIAEPLWPTGYSKMVISARKGYNVNVFRQKYDKDGNPVGEPELLYMDKYAAVQGELHYGTGPSTLPKPQG